MAAAATSSPSSSLAASSSSSVSSSSDSEPETKNKLKRKYAGSDSDSDSEVDSDDVEGHEDESADSDSGLDSDADTSKTNKQKLKNLANEANRKRQPDEDADMDVDEQEGEGQILSHKEQRRLRKKQKQLAEQNENDAPSKTTKKAKQEKEKGKDGPRRQNSIWVGNLAFRTTPDALRTFFADAGEVTRVNMPMKAGSGGKEKVNRGFAYVDFSTPEAKIIAITLSEKNLDGRRLLIKDGDDFAGRPTSTSSPIDPSNTNNNPASSTNPNQNSDPTATGHSKTVQKILSAQKQPPCPCLFLGNLGFEATPEGIREMFEGHARTLAELQRAKEKKAKEKAKGRRGKGGGKDDDLLGVENDNENDGSDEEDGEGGENVEVDVGIKKVRMGTFEDSGMCKGFAFVDFTSTQHATSALTNPRNHFLDGRALVVEYASPDAARRGGYREKSNPNSVFGKKKAPKRGGENKYGVKKKEKRKREAAENEDENVDEDREGVRDETARIEDPPVPKAKHQRTTTDNKEDRKWNSKMKSKPTKRPKPGAALALAQREKYAIVPSEGTRLKFS
ncbi:RNA-binding domain-containing protein [Fomitiporia mediterranea MF3/22]|uniref:RNA-binding domain-containing protein n=1 Tax=Fomitiporia mediterranea (strain MF3/22) TaxID=694068 RepID=UPI0004408EE3|nr:RNA-binding domain-containing protein [Fomitiporia mediterranea MF3/22]EJD00946.1 RNA-binding domain-containing protein [Fomitiporia mediterranea MF3/22]